MKIKKFNENSQNENFKSDIELELIKFFESFNNKFNINRQWIVDRFNDNITNEFINYVSKELNKIGLNDNTKNDIYKDISRGKEGNRGRGRDKALREIPHRSWTDKGLY